MGNHGTSTSKTNKGKKSDRKHSGQSSKGESSTKSTSQTAAPQQTTPQQASGYTSDPNAGFFDYQQAQYYQDPYGQVQQGGGTDAYATTDEQYGWRQHTECIAKWSCVSSPVPEFLPTP